MGAYLIKNQEIINKKWYDVLIIILGILLSFAAVFASMYFGFTEYKLLHVEGVQGRYFIPLLIPILLLTINNKKIMKQE